MGNYSKKMCAETEGVCAHLASVGGRIRPVPGEPPSPLRVSGEERHGAILLFSGEKRFTGTLKQLTQGPHLGAKRRLPQLTYWSLTWFLLSLGPLLIAGHDKSFSNVVARRAYLVARPKRWLPRICYM